MYVLYALLFLVIGGIEAIIIRIQLFFPDNHFVSAETFNRMFTMHGTTMIFFVAMPIFVGFGNYLLPLMLGVRDIAFPTAQRFQLLDDGLRRATPLLQLFGEAQDCKERAPLPTWVGSPTHHLPHAPSRAVTRTDFWAISL